MAGSGYFDDSSRTIRTIQTQSSKDSKDGLRILNFQFRFKEGRHKTYLLYLLRTAVAILLPIPPPSLMGNAPIAPRGRHSNLASIPEVNSSQVDPVFGMTRTKSVNANANELDSTQDKTARYLPKGMNQSRNSGVSMPSRPYDSGGSSNTGGTTESPQWGWYINITSPTTEMHHSGSTPLRHNSQSSTRYLPKGMNRSSNGVIMPSKPYGCGGASIAAGIESPEWDWSIGITPPASDMYHCGSRYFPKKQDSLANASQTSSGTEAPPNHQPNRIFQDMQKGAPMGWSSVPL
jgi:hypothetical protein